MTGGLDTQAAVTRSMLGWGVVAGPFYLAFALVLALTRDGFELSRHSISLLTLGEGGWMQILNFALTGTMVIVAGWGVLRALDQQWQRAGVAVVIAGAAILLAGVFRPDPVDGFPIGSTASVNPSGILHLAMGTVEFLAMAVAAVLLARFFSAREESARSTWCSVAAAVIVLAFIAGAALSSTPAGVALLWLAVLTTFGWLLTVSAWTYRAVPHPDLARRARGSTTRGTPRHT